ncbi:MAG: hypothetical protein L3J73_03075, partial [Thermoplasmata archaeon]|nr:hypothetical protein [Thermoplasmata archaeon]
VGWSVSLDNVIQTSSGTSLTFYEPNGSYYFAPGGAADYFANPNFGVLNLHGVGLVQNVTYSLFEWGVYFGESGLLSGAPWYVNFTAGPPGFPLPPPAPIVGSGQIFALANGSYSYTVQTAAPGYLPLPSGALRVHGGGSVLVTFLPVNYTVTFQATGLTAGTSWAVNLSGGLSVRSTPMISFSEPNGVYPFTIVAVNGYRAVPSTGSVTVAGTDPPTIVIDFSSTWTYSAVFHESGLPVGSGWSVAIGAQFVSGLTDTVTLTEPNGTFGYVVQAVPGYTTTYSGLVTIAGANQSVPVVFVAQTFPVIVVEFGLPNGTDWSVTVTNASQGFAETHSSNGSAIIFYLPNGTYTVAVQVPPGYLATLSSGTFTVAGTSLAAPSVQVSPTANPGGGSEPSSSGVPAFYWWLLGAMGVALLLLAAIAILLWRRPPSRGPGNAEQ